jgi:hypothetical protein
MPRIVTRAVSVAAALLLALVASACESGDTHPTGPNGRLAFSEFVAIGTGTSMGAQSGGVVYTSQVDAWPTLLARQAVATFAVPLLRGPGCLPPLVAPLGLAVFLSGASTSVVDTSCAGRLDTLTPPTNNVALAEATAWDALNLTPRVISSAPASYSVGDRSRYPLVLGPTQSQVTAMLVQSPSFVSVELGATELLGAATSGFLVPATSYTQTTPYTYVPAAIFAPVYAAIADSVKRSGARAVLMGVPRMSNLASLRTGNELWNDRTALATFGIVVGADCNGSANILVTGVLVPRLAALAQATFTQQQLACTDMPGGVDQILLPADLQMLDAAADQMTAQVKQLADQNGWAFVDLNAIFASMMAARPTYSSATQLGCALPYGPYVSLDGIQPNVAGQQLIANAVATAINAKYGYDIPTVSVIPLTGGAPCP